jgi:hypothetical protein
MNKRITLAILATASLAAGFGAAQPAQASCIQVEGVDDCINPCDSIAQALVLAPEPVKSHLPPLNCVK